MLIAALKTILVVACSNFSSFIAEFYWHHIAKAHLACFRISFHKNSSLINPDLDSLHFDFGVLHEN